jgi:hypothetical protein
MKKEFKSLPRKNEERRHVQKPFKKVLKTCRSVLRMRREKKRLALARARAPVPMALQFPNTYGRVSEVRADLTLKEKIERFLSEERERRRWRRY